MLFRPKIKKYRITDLSPDLLRRFGIKGLIIDVDNTLSTHHGEQLIEGLPEWLDLMRQEGFRMVVLSNSKRARVEPFSQKIGLDFVSLGLKPLPFKYGAALKQLGLKRKEVAAVGDQIFTDILGGNLVGVKTVLVTPVLPEKGWSFRLRRRIEKFLIEKWNLEETEG